MPTKKLGRPPRIKKPVRLQVYLSGDVRTWLMAQPRGASETIREMAMEKMAAEAAS